MISLPFNFLTNYYSTHSRQLLTLTEKLYRENQLSSYLTPQQLFIIEELINTSNKELKLKIWDLFLKGKLILNVEKIKPEKTPQQWPSGQNLESIIKQNEKDNLEQKKNENREGSTVQRVSSSTTSNNGTSFIPGQEHSDQNFNEYNSENNTPSDLYSGTDFTDIDLANLMDQLNGVEFVGNLSLKLRYALWEKFIDYGYSDAENNSKTMDMEYLLLDEDKVYDSDNENTKQEEHKVETIGTIVRNEDDDYDDYDDENDEAAEKIDKPPLQKHSSIETDGTSGVNKDVILSDNFDENGNYILKIEISKEILSRLRITNTEQIMERFDKIYHNFENDKEALMKRLKLEANDELIESSRGKRTYQDSLDENDEIGDSKSETSGNNATSNITSVNNRKNNSAVTSTVSKKNNSKTIGSKNEKKENKKEFKTQKKIKPNDPYSFLGNLPIKHLISQIENNRNVLSIPDLELKHLLLDVRKSRSKWASDDKIGQEELYEACEKVVLDLRNYTQHSTAFLNKVSKRDAPNYYTVIKKPMDLNTVLKKLKTFQYRSKQEFTDDVMLIWKNCLTYNSDPKHFLRGHALAMQKKSLQLINNIPDIIVRDRAEVEKELEELDKEQNEKNAERESSGGEGRGGGRGGTEEDEEEGRGRKHHKGKDKGGKGSKRGSGKQKAIHSLNKENEKQENTVSKSIDQNTELIKTACTPDTHAANTPLKSTGNGTGKTPGGITEKRKDIDVKKENEIQGQNEVFREDEDEDEEMSDDEGYSQYLKEKDVDKDDVELTLWKNITSKARAEICVQRSNIFKNSTTLNSKAEAIIRYPTLMKEHSQLLSDYKTKLEQEILSEKMKKESMLRNGFGAAILFANANNSDISVHNNISDSSNNVLSTQKEGELEENKTSNNNNNNNNNEDDEDEVVNIDADDLVFLPEYNVGNSLPDIAYVGISNELLNNIEDDLINEQLSSDTSINRSLFLANTNKGLTPKLDKNIRLIEEIRHICHKISLIRTLYNRQLVYSNSVNSSTGGNNSSKISASQQNLHSSFYRKKEINNDLDIDPVSRLHTRNSKGDKAVIRAFLHKIVSKIAMNSGFEATQQFAINSLTDITCDYLSNLIKTVKIHTETISNNKKDTQTILLMTMLENGIMKPDELYSYIEKEFQKKTRKLKEIKYRLNLFLKDLLRPSLNDLSERNFEDESQSFITGEYSSELTGEDFFGFKELGLDKEFKMLNSSIPLHLLAFQFQAKRSTTGTKDKKIQPEEFSSITYTPITKDDLEQKDTDNDRGSNHPKIIGLLKPLLLKQYERCKNISLESNPQWDKNVLLEDTQMPNKPKPPRLPPTGKIGTIKKKLVKTAYFLPEALKEQIKKEKQEELKRLEELKKQREAKARESQLMDKQDENVSFSQKAQAVNGFNTENKKSESTFSLSLPPVIPNI
ncbi:SAGA histone acetyltransferase complex subunit SPT7 SCDLUD_000745 [Saccharomycodes ludwigii]|uniref:SAGA histone acetyltransferase complex subunit SPT7 n=1 Tax=Saccharomycodes ludwigii TaxID=36035 RepID=UPI001E87AE07|nr:hypothetical protein SCDLUD_000745 [Saccharomycodes ludwigii]KAH3903132.1 hypothetical protein SCDLUD_000745 [Saccharomycodes ludwigii]